MSAVIAKFRIVSFNTQQGRVELEPVTGGSRENEQFFKYTPGGRIEMQTVNEPAFDIFTRSREFYVHFIPADDEVAGESDAVPPDEPVTVDASGTDEPGTPG